MRRTVRAHDPTDLASPLEYAAEVLPDDDPAGDDAAAPCGVDGQPLKTSRRWVLAALAAGGGIQTVKHLGDHVAAQGHPLRERTIQDALADLEAAGLAEGTEAIPGMARYWSPATPPAADALDSKAQP